MSQYAILLDNTATAQLLKREHYWESRDDYNTVDGWKVISTGPTKDIQELVKALNTRNEGK